MNKKNARFIKKIKENPTLEALKLYYINEDCFSLKDYHHGPFLN